VFGATSEEQWGMRRITLALAAAVGLAAAVQSASASTFTIMEPPFRATWRSLRFSISEISMNCAVTLEGSFASSTIGKVAGRRIGSVTRAQLTGCSGGTATVLTEALPWAVQYSSFTGTLPEITSVTTRIVGAAFRFFPTGSVQCLLRSEESRPLVTIFERSEWGTVTGLRASETSSIPLRGGFPCEVVGGTVSGTAGVTLAGQRADLEILLGTEGVALAQPGESGPTRLGQLTIVSPATQGTLGIENRTGWRDGTITEVRVVGSHSEKYELVDQREPAACRAEVVLLVDGNNTCNARVKLKEGQPRGFPSTVQIVYRYSYWLFFTAVVSQRFTVLARA
jgi:hypothetical protein